MYLKNKCKIGNLLSFSSFFSQEPAWGQNILSQLLVEIKNQNYVFRNIHRILPDLPVGLPWHVVS